MAAFAPPSRAPLSLTWDWAEKSFIVFALVMFGTSFLRLFVGGGENTAVVRITYLSLYAAGGMLCVLHYRRVLEVIRQSPVFVLLLLFPLLTILWSVNQEETLQRSIAVLGPSLLALYIGTVYRLRSIILLLAAAHLIMSIMDVFAIVAIPKIGITQEEEWHGAWRGVHGHKNGFGAAAAFGCLALLFATTVVEGFWRIVTLAGLALNLVFLAVSDSLTSQLVLPMALGAFVVGLGRGWSRLYVFLLAAGLCCVLLVIVLIAQYGPGALIGALGRSSTMSNRMPMWSELTSVIAQRPMLGYGYAAFWESGLPELHRVARNLQFVPFYSHNGALELLLDGGFVLLMTALVAMLSCMVRASRMIRPGIISSYYPLAFFIGFVLANVSESTFLARNSLLWIQFVLFAAVAIRTVHIKIVGQAPLDGERL
ncbi:MAG: O-antigen ligase family protein [Beijerinckiaceae bacterium]|nr:O-antigen ligase family protein [Beijerinckiaceae bacterium]